MHYYGKKYKKFNGQMKASLTIVFFVIIVLFIALIGKIIVLNETNGERYSKAALSQQTYRSAIIPYKRGQIYDRNMTELAKSVKVYNLILDPSVMLEKETYKEPTIRALKTAFGIEESEINQILKEKPKARYVVYKKGLSYDEVQVFKDLVAKNDFIKGVWFEDDYIRTYPQKTLASSVLGFTFKGNVGNSGIEGYYNGELNGSDGREYGYFDANLNLKTTVKPATNGNSIVSTIDANVQSIVEKHIKGFQEEVGSKHTAVMIMNPNNGEIYAMASNTSYDLNNPKDLSSLYTEKEVEKMSDKELDKAYNELWRNFCISDTFEPGSTFKPMTVAAAMEEYMAKESDCFHCDGHESVLGVRIRCAKREGHGDISLAESIAFSCNDALMQIGAKLGSSNFIKYQKVFGFGTKTGIDLVGEAKGIIYDEEHLKPVELATNSFGQSFNTTMVQLMSAFNSTINGGNYYKPHITKQILNENGAIIKNIEPELVRQTISESTSTFLRNAMHDTVTKGSAKTAAIEGYEIGGKTGTAQKLPRGNGKYLVSFIGFAPVEKPQVSFYVVIDEPNSDHQANSKYATTLAASIMEEVLPFLGIYKDTTLLEEKDEEGQATSPLNPTEPEQTKNPEATVSPEGTMSPEATVSPEGMLSPETTVSPEATLPPSTEESDSQLGSSSDESVEDQETEEEIPPPAQN